MSHHGVPAEVLSDRGKVFLSGLMEEVGQLLGIHKLNTSAYHPQTGDLVERYNHTLHAILSKTVDHGKKNWDEPIPYVLFPYRACLQESTKESPYFLLYGRDPRLPNQAMLSPAKTRRVLDLREYGAELHERMSAAWEGARDMIKQAQNRQKLVYDRRRRCADFIPGERVFLLQPSSITGELKKLARPVHGPYRIISLDTNTAHVRRVDQPQDEPILVVIDRLKRCPDELEEGCWPPKATGRGRRKMRRKAVQRTTGDTTPTPGGTPQMATEGHETKWS